MVKASYLSVIIISLILCVSKSSKLTFLNEKGKENYTGWKSITWEGETKWLYFDENGNMVKGWGKIMYQGEYHWFYFEQGTGFMVTGWQYLYWGDTRHWFYFDTTTGVMATGWKQLSWGGGVNWFYFHDSGFMATGWNQLSWGGGVNWFYFDLENGYMYTGWQKLDWEGTSSWYYFDPSDGYMLANTCRVIDGTNYCFDASGRLIESEQVWVNYGTGLQGVSYQSQIGMDYGCYFLAACAKGGLGTNAHMIDARSWCASQGLIRYDDTYLLVDPHTIAARVSEHYGTILNEGFSFAHNSYYGHYWLLNQYGQEVFNGAGLGWHGE